MESMFIIGPRPVGKMCQKKNQIEFNSDRCQFCEVSSVRYVKQGLRVFSKW